MRARADRFRSLGCCAGMVVALAAARWGRAEDETAAVAREPRFNLARLAAIEQEYGNGGAEEAAAPWLTAGYDPKEGFYLSDADKKAFLLKIGVQLQIRYTYKGRDERGDSTTVGGSLGEVGDRDSTYWELERARIKLEGFVLRKELTYVYQLDGDTDGGGGSPSGGVKTVDAYVLYWAGQHLGGESSMLGIGAGQWKTHFLRQEPNSSSKLQMVDRSLANEFFNIDRNLGAWMQGAIGPVFYAVAVINSIDSVNTGNTAIDHIPGFAAKLDFTLVGENEKGKYEESNFNKNEDAVLFVVGASAATDQNNGTSFTATQQDFKAYTFGLDTVFKWAALSLQAEYMGRWLDYESGNTAAEGETSALYTHGFYVQGGIFLIPRTLELAGRVSGILTDTGPFQGNAVEAGPGLNWYISGNHKIKLQTDVMYYDISADLPNQTESMEVTASSSSSPFASAAANLAEGEQGVMWRTQLQLSF